jgi:hypothetical protein
MWPTLPPFLSLYSWLFLAGTQSAATCLCWFLARVFFYPEDEAIHSSETSVHTRSTRRHIPENGIFHKTNCFHHCNQLLSQHLIGVVKCCICCKELQILFLGHFLGCWCLSHTKKGNDFMCLYSQEVTSSANNSFPYLLCPHLTSTFSCNAIYSYILYLLMQSIENTECKVVICVSTCTSIHLHVKYMAIVCFTHLQNHDSTLICVFPFS